MWRIPGEPTTRKTTKEGKASITKTKNTPPRDHILAALKRNTKVEYAAVKAAAEKKGPTIYPIMYGRATAMLGLVKVAPRGSKKAAPRKPANGRRKKVARRGPGRPRKQAGALDALAELVAQFKAVEK